MSRSSLFRLSRRNKRHSRRRQRAMFLEALESRDLLATVNVVPYWHEAGEVVPGAQVSFRIFRDGSTTSGLTVDFTLGGTATEGKDYETVDPKSATIPVGETEAFVVITLKDDIWWENGTESIELFISPGSYDIGNGIAAVGIIDDEGIGDPFEPVWNNAQPCNCSCTCTPVNHKVQAASGDASASNRAGLQHDSRAAGGQVEVTVNANFTEQAQYASIEIETTLNGQGVEGPEASAGPILNTSETYQFVVPMDVEDFGITEDGYYKWTLEMTESYPESPDIVRDTEGGVKVIHFAGGEFGPGWLHRDVDRLKVQTSGDYTGALWIRGDYQAYWFDEFNGQYVRESGEPDFSTLALELDGSFTLTKKTGEVLHFSDAGDYFMLDSRTDRNGNETLFTYYGHSIATITDPAGRVTTFNYTGSLVTSITDPYDRITTLEYVGGRLAKIIEPDPDGTGSQVAPESQFTYNGDDQIASITDPEGNTTSFTYVDKLLRTVTHPGGGVETYEVQFGRAIGDPILTSEVKTLYEDEVGNDWVITFNPLGNALKIVNPQGKITEFTINLENLVTQRRDPDPDDGGPQGTPITEYEYDSKRNLTVLTHPDGGDELWGYDANFARVTSHTNRLGYLTTFAIDTNNGNYTTITQVNNGGSYNSVWEFTYTATGVEGLVTSVTDPRDYVTLYGYTAGGLLESITYAYGTADEAVESFSYDAYENLATFTDGLGRVIDYTFDLLDRLTTITLPDPDGAGSLTRPVYTYEYNKNNFLKKEIDPLGYETEYAYNGRLDIVEIKQPDPDGAGSQTRPTTTFAYDLHRRNTSVTDPLGRETAFAYDTLDRTSSVTLPDPDGAGSQTSSVYAYAYDHIHRLTQITDPLSNITLLNHATWNQVSYTLPDPDGAGVGEGAATMVDIWNVEGWFTSHTDEISRGTAYSYDQLGQVTAITTPGPLGSTYSYDKSGNVISSSNPRGSTTTYEYDARDRLVEVTEPDPDGVGPLASPVWTYAYNDASELVSMTDPRGYVTTYTYDGIGRLKTVTEPDPDGGGSQTTPVWTYHYDAASRLTGILDPLANFTTYVYDGLGRLTEVIEEDPDGAGSATHPITSFTYDAVGNLLSVTDPIGRVTSYAYDGLDRLVSVAEPSPGGTTSYTYDKVSNLLSVTDALSNTTSYAYNNRYFLIGVTQPTVAAGTPVWEYEVDAAGQVLSVTDPLDRVTAFEYGVPGWITKVTRPDPDGPLNPQTAPETSYTYDGNWNVTSVTDPLGRVTSYEYDFLDRLTKMSRPDPAGGASPTVTSYAYDPSGNLTSLTDPLSRVTTYANDGLNRRTSVTQPDPDGGGSLTSPVTSFAYDAVGNVTSITDPRGNVTTRTLDNLYRQISVTEADPDGGGSLTSPVTSFTYDAAGQLLSVTDPLSRVTNYEYNGLGLTSKIIEPDPDGGGSLTRPETTFSYNAVGMLTSVTDPLSHTTTYLYDALYRNTRITDANSGQTNFAYDMVGNLLSLTDPVGNTTAWTYDGLDRVTKEENELLHSRLFEYDPADNLVQKTDRNGRVTEYDYDDLDRLVEETWIDVPAPTPTLDISTTTQGDISDEVQRVGIAVSGMGFIGGTFTLTYDGQTTGAIAYNASAATVQSALEALSNLAVGDISVTKSADTSMAQSWDVTFGGALAETDVSQITIDSTNVSVAGMKMDVQTTMTQGGLITYEVQAATIANANGGTFTLSFQGQVTNPIDWDATAAEVDTALEALTTIDTVGVSGNAGGPWTITFTGTHSGENVPQLTGNGWNLENHQNRVLSFTYDAADQLTAASDPSAAYSYVYDALGRVTQQTQDITGLTPTIVFNQAFDAASNRTELSATIGANADFKNTYAYDNLNRMTQVIQQGNSGNAVAPKRIDFAYNAAGQFTQLDRYQSTGTSNNVAQTFFTYDGMGRLATLDHKQGATVLAGYDYTYDAASRITSIDSTVEGLSTFTYDVTNQLTAADHTSQPDENYSFDLNGNRTMANHTVGDNNQLQTDGVYNYTYDNEGNLIERTKISDSTSEEYEWDWRNRLVGVTFKNGSGATTKTIDNEYDVFNRWVRRTEDPDGPGGSSPTDTFFAYDGYNPVLQFDGTEDDDLSNRNLFGPAVDQILAVEDVSSLTSAGNSLWGLSDHLGTPRDVADLNEGTGTTTVTNHRTYNSFNTQTAETNSAVDFIFGETGKMLDEDTLANWHLNRWTRAGRWLSQDPIGFGGGDANLVRLIHNNPQNFADPDGLEDDPTIYDPKKRPGKFSDLLGPDGAARGRGNDPLIEQRQEGLEQGKEIGREGQRLMGDLNPVIGPLVDGGEAGFGHDAYSGRKLSTSERCWAGIYALLGIVPGADEGGDLARSAAKRRGAAAEQAVEKIVKKGGDTPVPVRGRRAPITGPIEPKPNPGLPQKPTPAPKPPERVPAPGIGKPAPRVPDPNWRQSKPDSQKLARNLGIEPGSGKDAHHIVAGEKKHAEPARKQLEKYQIDINCDVNGVPLEGGKGAPKNVNPRRHRGNGLHSDEEGIKAVNDRLADAVDGVDDWAEGRRLTLEELRKIREEIQNGTFPPIAAE